MSNVPIHPKAKEILEEIKEDLNTYDQTEKELNQIYRRQSTATSRLNRNIMRLQSQPLVDLAESFIGKTILYADDGNHPSRSTTILSITSVKWGKFQLEFIGAGTSVVDNYTAYPCTVIEVSYSRLQKMLNAFRILVNGDISEVEESVELLRSSQLHDGKKKINDHFDSVLKEIKKYLNEKTESDDNRVGYDFTGQIGDPLSHLSDVTMLNWKTLNSLTGIQTVTDEPEKEELFDEIRDTQL
jgi:hypothetical protein